MVYGKLGSQDSQMVRNHTGQDRSCVSEHMFPGLIAPSLEVLSPVHCQTIRCQAFHHTDHHKTMIDHERSPKNRNPDMIGCSASLEGQA